MIFGMLDIALLILAIIGFMSRTTGGVIFGLIVLALFWFF